MNDATAPAMDAPANVVLNPEIIKAISGPPGDGPGHRIPTAEELRQAKLGDQPLDPKTQDYLPTVSIFNDGPIDLASTQRPQTGDETPKPDSPPGAPTDAAKAPEGNWWDGAVRIVEDLAVGAYKELTEHTLEVAETVAIGAAIGVVGTFVTPVAIGAGIIGAGYLGYQALTHGGEIINDASIVANPEGHSQEELAKAHADLQGLGGSATLAAAGMAGGLAGGWLSAAAIASEEASVAASIAADDAFDASLAASDTALTSSVGNAESALVVNPSFEPFTVADTTMSVGNKVTWESLIDTNKSDYGRAILSFADRWGALMEKGMAAGKPLDSTLAWDANLAADTEGLSGSMYSFARNIMVQTWKYGAELKKIAP